MAAPAYVWEHNADIGGGDRVPTIVTMEATAIETKVGTFLCTDGSGRVALGTDGNTSLALGLAVTATTAAYTAGDPIKVALFFPGEVIKGKASSDASTYSGFISKAYDLDADGRLDHKCR